MLQFRKNAVVTAVIMTLSLGMGGSVAAADFVLNLGTSVTDSDPTYEGIRFLQKEVSERTNGAVEIRTFPSSALGKDEDILEQARAGANVAVLVDGGRLAEFNPSLGILGAPYLFTSTDQMRKFVSSDTFNTWADDLAAASGHRILSFNWYQGERHLLTNRDVALPEDLSGVRMRTPGAPVWMETIRAMGATPTPMGWTEVYTALQTSTIDAAEAQVPAIWGSKLNEVTSTMTRTGHFFLITGIVGSEAWFKSLPAEYQQVLLDVTFEAGNVGTAATEAAISELTDQMSANGLKVVDVDKAPFIEATASVYEDLGLNELRAQVEAVLQE